MESQEKSKKEGSLTLVLALATLIAAFGSSFQYGYNVAVINSPFEIMKQFYNVTYTERTGESMSTFSLTLLWAVSVSMFPFGGFIGSLLVGPLVSRFGRKGTLLFNNIFSIVPAILMVCSKVAGSFEMIILSRLLVGICAGLSSNVVPMYLGELAPKNLRGALGVVPQVFITVGILVAQIFGLRSLLATEEDTLTRHVLSAYLQSRGARATGRSEDECVPGFVRHKPRRPGPHLTPAHIHDAYVVCVCVCETHTASPTPLPEELEEIQLEDQAERAAGTVSVLKLFSMRSLRWQLLTIIILMAGQQLSGVNAIYYYADVIYSKAGVKDTDVQYVTAGTGAVNVVMTICAVFVVELLGRRLLILLGFAICFTACVVLTIALVLQETVTWMPYLSIVCVIAYVIGHAIGPSPIPALLITEVFLQSSRPSAFMVGGSVHWLSNFTVGLVFPFIQAGLGPYSFIIFAVVCLLTTIYTFFIVPETKAKTFMEINQIFSKMNKMSEVHPEREELKDLPPSTLEQ
ncbi:solute carrier family 2, facilitated glucose transporter member 5 [Echinops telfairi]|uniref:Solute carrier family 2, facilitated glucose transporter member 5 n=1 Tax=Echinops telfairi TaxID=9371 RepID=A0AC55DTS4_ECHTE|nr:solute carrier family 2, facilitated glucose transporter member 5 [Echinops telfairi]